MNVGESVRLSMRDWVDGEPQSAMLHACNAIDGTAKKRYPKFGVGKRFTTLIRDHYAIFGPMALPGMNLAETSWEIDSIRGSGVGGIIDTADVIYGVHRCVHGHGDVLPDGFELLPDAAEQSEYTRWIYSVTKKAVQLPDRTIFGLLGVAVMAPENHDQRTLDEDYLVYGRKKWEMRINDWWGKAVQFRWVVASDPPGPMTVRGIL